jgi:hypothetical protein
VKLAILAGSGGKTNLFGFGDIPVLGTPYEVGVGFYNSCYALQDSNAPWYERFAGGLHLVTFALTVGEGAAQIGGHAPFSRRGSVKNVDPASPDAPAYRTVANGLGAEIEKLGTGEIGKAPIKATDSASGKRVVVLYDDLFQEGSFANVSEGSSLQIPPAVKSLGKKDSVVIIQKLADGASLADTNMLMPVKNIGGIPIQSFLESQLMFASDHLSNVGTVFYINIYRGTLYVNRVGP